MSWSAWTSHGAPGGNFLDPPAEEDVDNYDPSRSEKKRNEPPAPTKAMALRESSLLSSVGMLRVLGGAGRWNRGQ